MVIGLATGPLGKCFGRIRAFIVGTITTLNRADLPVFALLFNRVVRVCGCIAITTEWIAFDILAFPQYTLIGCAHIVIVAMLVG